LGPGVTILARSDPTVPWQVYLIATGYLLALVIAGLFPSGTVLPKPWATACAVVSDPRRAGLIGSLIHRAAPSKTPTRCRRSTGRYLYVLFQIAASLTCISGVSSGAGGSCRRASAGDRSAYRIRSLRRAYALSVALVMLVRDGHIRFLPDTNLWRSVRSPYLRDAARPHGALLRFDQLAVVGTPRTVRTQEMPAISCKSESHRGGGRNPKPSRRSAMGEDLKIPLELLQRSEPSIIQATLAASCSATSRAARRIFSSALSLLPPGTARFSRVRSHQPSDEYQPILYPDITTARGNIWARCFAAWLCRVAIFGTL